MKEVERVPGTPGHEACGCGHEHHHEHGHEEHEHHHHEHEEAASRETVPMPEGVEKRVYILENLGCANCAAKMERMIRELPGVRMATITYATKQLAVAADHQEALLPEFRRICASIEEGVTVTPRDYTPVKSRKRPALSRIRRRISWP